MSFEAGVFVYDWSAIAVPCSRIGVVVEVRSGEPFPYVVEIGGERHLYRECELQRADLGEVLDSLVAEAGLTPTVSLNCVSGLVGGRDHCLCDRCRARLGLDPLPSDEVEQFAVEARKKAYRQ